MRTHDVRDALNEVRDSVPVAAVDQAAFLARVRAARRRRRLARTGAVGAVAAALALVGLVVPRLVDRPGQQVASRPAGTGLPVVVDGRIRLLDDGGHQSDTGSSGTVVGTVGGDLVTLAAGVLAGPGGVRTPGVVAAYASASGVTYQLADLTITRPDGTVVRSGGRLVGAGDSAYVTERGGILTVHDRQGAHVLRLGSDGSRPEPDAVEIGGDIVVATSGGTVGLFDTDGHRRTGFLGGVTGALSPDGATYAYARTAQEARSGMRPGVALYDVSTGRLQRVPLAAPAVDLTWHERRLFVLTEKGSGRALWECDPQACRSRLTRADGRLSLR